MRTVKRIVLQLFAYLLLFVLLCLRPTGAYAISDYDNILTQGEYAVLCPDNNFHDISTHVTLIMESMPSSYDKETFMSYYQTALNEGKGWGATQVKNHYYSSTGSVVLFVLIDPEDEFYFTSDPYWAPEGTLRSPSIVSATFYCDNGGYQVMFNSNATYRDIGYPIDPNGEYRRPIFINADISYPLDYEGMIVPSVYSAPVPTYVAMGDSFSSGEGNPAFEYGTDRGGVNPNGCHRSPLAYPRLLQTDLNLDLGPTAFVACSGATTANITGGQFNEPAQTIALSDDTEVVTITVGGNDVGFGNYVIGCAVSCGPITGPLVYNGIMDNITAPAFKANLITTYEEILEEAPNAEVYVGDYPYISTPGQITCGGFDFTGARSVQVALNDVIEDAVNTVRLTDTDIHYVDTNASGSPLAGKHLCNGVGSSYFNGLVLSPVNYEYSFHPNQNGHIAYEEVFADAIS